MTKKADEMEARAFSALERYGCTPQSMPEQGEKCVLYIRMPAAFVKLVHIYCAHKGVSIKSMIMAAICEHIERGDNIEEGKE